MPVPNYGENAHPLVMTFLMTRATQAICFIIIVGITANFAAEIDSAGGVVPTEISGTLAVTSLITLYTLLSFPFFWSKANMGLLLMAGIDFVGVIGFLVISVVLGNPLSYINCFIIGKASAAVDASNALAFTQSLASNLGKTSNLVSWVGATRNNCFETKTVWGLCIALCILFTCSSFLLPSIWFRARRAANAAAAEGEEKDSAA